jgi:hypothetical protein
VPVSVVRVRNVPIGVRLRVMLMPMCMRLSEGIVRFVLVLMMFVVSMTVCVTCQLVNVLVVVVLSQVEPYPHGHKRTRHYKLKRQWFTQCEDRGSSAEKWCIEK